MGVRTEVSLVAVLLASAVGAMTLVSAVDGPSAFNSKATDTSEMIGREIAIPNKDAFGRSIPKGSVRVFLNAGCMSCSDDFKLLISQPKDHTPAIYVMTEDPSKLLGVTAKTLAKNVYVLADRHRKVFPLDLYAFAPFGGRTDSYGRLAAVRLGNENHWENLP